MRRKILDFAEDASISGVESDEFDDVDRELKEKKEQERFLQSGGGYKFMREEERFGKLLGLILAILFWAVVVAIWVSATWKPS